MTDTFVLVGTDPSTAVGEFAQFAGATLHGPFTHDEAQAFAAEVVAAFAKVAAEDVTRFVYGAPRVEVYVASSHGPTPPLHAAGMTRAEWAARNWYTLPQED